MVPLVRLERTLREELDFESSASTIPPQGPAAFASCGSRKVKPSAARCLSPIAERLGDMDSPDLLDSREIRDRSRDPENAMEAPGG